MKDEITRTRAVARACLTAPDVPRLRLRQRGRLEGLSATTAIMKAMGEGENGASGFMEDYTYHLAKDGKYSLGAHMLEVCPSLGTGRPRMICQDVECVKPIMEMPNLPMARVMWKPAPDPETGIACRITAGGAHHTVLCYDSAPHG